MLVRRTDLNTSLSSNALTTVLGGAHRGNVDSVFVAGRVRKWRGHLVDHDIARVVAAAEESRARLMEEIDLQIAPF